MGIERSVGVACNASLFDDDGRRFDNAKRFVVDRERIFDNVVCSDSAHIQYRADSYSHGDAFDNDHGVLDADDQIKND